MLSKCSRHISLSAVTGARSRLSTIRSNPKPFSNYGTGRARFHPRQTQHTCRCSSATAPDVPGTATLSDTVRGAKAGDVLTAFTTTGRQYWLEVLQAKSPTELQVATYGKLLDLRLHEGFATLTPIGPYPDPSEPWIKKVPSLPEALHKWQAELHGVDVLQDSTLVEAHRMYSFDAYYPQVAQNLSLIVDGTGPNDPPLTEQQQIMLSSGELIAFLEGRKAICVVQLWIGWDIDRTKLMPLFRPYVMRLLKQIVDNPKVVMFTSAAPGNLGLSAVVSAKKEPFRSWAQHLTTFGAQAALVADSAYYKMLVGRILGYKEENILHHVKVKGGGVLHPKMLQMVEQDLADLSSSKAVLPWNESARKKKENAAATTKQQLPRGRRSKQ